MDRVAAPEGLSDRHRAVHELRDRREQRDLDAISGQVTQRQDGFQAGDATPGDQNTTRSGLAHASKLAGATLDDVARESDGRS